METAAALVDILAVEPEGRWAAALDAWCQDRLYPWFRDHVEWDASIQAQWSERDIAPDGPLGMDLLVSAARERPHLFAELGPYLDMQGSPATTERVRTEVREMLRAGWRPPLSAPATRDQLVSAVRQSLAQPARSVA